MKGLGLYFERTLSIRVSLWETAQVLIYDPTVSSVTVCGFFTGTLKSRRSLSSADVSSPPVKLRLSLIALCVCLINQYDGSLLFINMSHAQRDELFVIISAEEKLLSSNWSMKHQLWLILRGWRMFVLWYHLWFSVFIDQSIDAVSPINPSPPVVTSQWPQQHLPVSFWNLCDSLLFISKNCFCFFLCFFFCHFVSFYNIFLFFYF